MAGSKYKSNIASTHERYREASDKLTKAAANAVAKEATQVGKDIGKDFFAQLLGLDTGKKTENKAQAAPKAPEKGLPQPGVTVDIFSFLTHTAGSAEKSIEKPKARVEAHMNHGRDIEKSGERATRAEMNEMSRNIQEIQAELRKLLNSSKILEVEFAQVAVEQAPVEVGKYHMNFFEWMLLVIRQAREKVENSGAWLNTVKGKGAKKNGYWNMYKKHGTTFGLSSERSTATQTG